MALCWIHIVFVYIAQKTFFYTKQNLVILLLYNSIFLKISDCLTERSSIFLIYKNTFSISFLLAFTFISSMCSLKQTILVSRWWIRSIKSANYPLFLPTSNNGAALSLLTQSFQSIFSNQVRHLWCTYQLTLSPRCLTSIFGASATWICYVNFWSICYLIRA